MGELETGCYRSRPRCDLLYSSAVDPPVRRIAPSIRARRHRGLTGLSGILLFACMFLPAVKGCNEPVMPHQIPPFLPPYLYGLVFALIAIAPGARGLHFGHAALRVLAALVVLASVMVLLFAPPVGIVELIIGAMLLVIVVHDGPIETRVVTSGIVIAVVCTLWFGLWVVTGALIGAYLSLASSIGLLIGCVAWRRELASRPAVDMPHAVAVPRQRQ